MKFLKEFKEFAVRGNVVDLAVGIIIGGAFGKIVSSAVADLLMPPLGFLMGKIDFKDKKLVLADAVTATGDKGEVVTKVPEVAITYGQFIQHSIDFILMAFAVFLLVKAINTLKRAEAAAPPPVPALTPTEKLLAEIRALLATKR